MYLYGNNNSCVSHKLQNKQKGNSQGFTYYNISFWKDRLHSYDMKFNTLIINTHLFKKQKMKGEKKYIPYLLSKKQKTYVMKKSYKELQCGGE